MAGATQVQGKRKTKVGRVVSDKMDKTIVVSVERLTRHPLYKRVVRMTTKFAVHDELNKAKVGDTVLIEESRPLSRRSAGASSRSPPGPARTGRPRSWPRRSRRPRRSTRRPTRAGRTPSR